MTDRDRFVRCCLGEKVDRPPYWLFWGPWHTTWQRWQREGMPFKDWGELSRHFGCEAPPAAIPVNCGPCPRIERQVLEETDEHVISTDSWGIKRRDIKSNVSMCEFLEFPVKGREDWERFKAERLDPDHPDRLAGNWANQAREWMEKGIPIQLGYFPDVTLFGGIRWMLGDEECLLAFYTMPDVVHDMMNRLTDIYLKVFEKVMDAGIRVDVIHIWEDMSGCQGPLISPAHFREFMTPNYARLRAFGRAHGIPLMSVDTDGNPDLIVPPMMEGGVNYLWPMEVAAHADVNVFRRKYPDLALMGGFDKRAAAAGPAAIDAEMDRLRPVVRAGRYIPQFDHLIPDDVSWDNFCHFAEALRKLVGKK